MKTKTRTPRRSVAPQSWIDRDAHRWYHNPAGTKLVKSFIKASRKEYPEHIATLKALAPRDPLLKRFAA